jgi:hypothetical protein
MTAGPARRNEASRRRMDMAKLDVKFIRESLTGKWGVDVVVNGNKVTHLIMDWPDAFGLAIGVEPGKVVPLDCTVQEGVKQIAMAGWRSDVQKWYGHWYNNKGGYGELQYTYQEGNTLFGYIHDVPADGADPVEWAVAVEIPDHDHFIYRYFGVKGTRELHAKRVK